MSSISLDMAVIEKAAEESGAELRIVYPGNHIRVVSDMLSVAIEFVCTLATMSGKPLADLADRSNADLFGVEFPAIKVAL